VDFHVSLAGPGDLGARIYRQLHEAVIDGRLRAGERLPPTRELAKQLAVSRNTVALAYERLTAEGFLVGRVGAGTFVCATPPAPASAQPAAARAVWQGVWAPSGVSGTPEFDFRVGIPDLHEFPMAGWRRVLMRELRELPPSSAGYGEPAGHAGLRVEIARRIGLSRSVRADPADLIVTQGAQQALDLVGRVLVAPGDVVAVEEPGYPPARELFASLGAEVVGVPVDAEGLVVSAIPPAARLVYTTPSHQFPLGMPMSLDRRAALLDWAHGRDAMVIEDDYDSEFRFADRPLEPLHALDRGDRVLYVGSFSKTMLPMLRLGFLVAPASLRTSLRAAKLLTDRHGDLATQGALARFMAGGLFTRHVRRSARAYTVRRQLILSVLARDFATRLTVLPATAGLHLTVRPLDSVDVPALVARAVKAGVSVESLGDYYGFDAPVPGLVLGYGSVRLPSIEPGLRRLSELW
jgi:GntR family transcriptional regulator/MocR family aminotransferase